MNWKLRNGEPAHRQAGWEIDISNLEIEINQNEPAQRQVYLYNEKRQKYDLL